MKRSILTEKVARRGYHISREYAVDPLEMLSVGDIMSADLITVPALLAVDKLSRTTSWPLAKRGTRAIRW